MSVRLPSAMVLALTVADSSLAQQSTGSRMGPPPARIEDKAISDEEKARRTLTEFAGCVVGTAPARVQSFLATAPGSMEAQKWATKLADDRCLLAGQLIFSEPLIRLHIYQVLYRKQFREKAPTDLVAVPPIDYGKAEVGVPRPSEVALRQFGDCVARSNPVEARNLVLSDTSSNAERTAFQALMPSFSDCLPKEEDFKFSKSVLKGVVAETLYRLSLSAGASAAAGSAF